MGPKRRPSRIPPEVFRFSGLGCAFAAGVLLFTGIGWVVDGQLGIFPAGTLIGALAGTALSTVSVWRNLQQGLDEDADTREPPES